MWVEIGTKIVANAKRQRRWAAMVQTPDGETADSWSNQRFSFSVPAPASSQSEYDLFYKAQKEYKLLNRDRELVLRVLMRHGGADGTRA